MGGNARVVAAGILFSMLAFVGAGSANADHSYGDYPDPREVTKDVPSTWIDPGLYRVTYTGELWNVEPDLGRARPISYDEWETAGFPSYKAAHTDYVKYAWSPAIFAVNYFGPDRAQWYWDHLTPQQWTTAGRPAPRNAGWIDGTYFFKNGTSSELFASVVNGPPHKLTYAEWADAGFPEYFDDDRSTYYRLPWDSSGAIVYYDQFHNGLSRGRQIGYQEWANRGFPTPKLVDRLPDDLGFFIDSAGAITYAARGYSKYLTYAEWRAAGFPTPTPAS